jgi:Protein of unknown function (DUF3431)
MLTLLTCTHSWPNVIYTVDDLNATLHTPMNKGKEAMAYLTYVIDHYKNLPSTMVFLHSHRDGYPAAWHNDNPNYDNVESVNDLNIDFIQRNGYANLRCNWSVGCPNELQLFRDPPQGDRLIEHTFATVWKDIFPSNDMPSIVATPCCAQFAVSRNQVLGRPLADYERYRNWLIGTELDSDVSGRILEYSWHIVFGREAV